LLTDADRGWRLPFHDDTRRRVKQDRPGEKGSLTLQAAQAALGWDALEHQSGGDGDRPRGSVRAGLCYACRTLASDLWRGLAFGSDHVFHGPLLGLARRRVGRLLWPGSGLGRGTPRVRGRRASEPNHLPSRPFGWESDRPQRQDSLTCVAVPPAATRARVGCTARRRRRKHSPDVDAVQAFHS